MNYIDKIDYIYQFAKDMREILPLAQIRFTKREVQMHTLELEKIKSQLESINKVLNESKDSQEDRRKEALQEKRL